MTGANIDRCQKSHQTIVINEFSTFKLFSVQNFVKNDEPDSPFPVPFFKDRQYKNSPFINNKLFIKILQYYVKTCFQRYFEFFKKHSFIKKSVEQLKNEECKKRYHKKSQLSKFFKYV